MGSTTAQATGATPTRHQARQSGGSTVAPLATIVVVFVLSRAGFWLAGVRFDLTTLDLGSEQLLGVRLLKDELFTSVWHLHSQPPLFNLFCGLILHLPSAIQATAAWVCFMAIGLALVIATYLLLLEMRVAHGLALVVALLLTVSPTTILYENWLFYAYPSAAALALAGLFFARYLRTQRWGYGVAFFTCVSGLVLLDSAFQAVWMVAVLVLAVAVSRIPVRRVLAVAVLPVLVVVGWTVKDAVMFGTYTTSSWLGMNLADMTLVPAARSGQLRSMVREGELTPLALVGPWKEVAAYTPRFVGDPHTGVAALDDREGNPHYPNFNNIVYVRVSSLLLADDIHYIEHEPRDYLRNVGISAGAWLTPSDQYPFVYDNWLKIHPLVDVYDSALGWQLHEAPGATTAFHAIDGSAPPVSQISWSTVAIYVIALLGTPVVLWFRRRDLGRRLVGVAVLLWGTTLYGYLTSSLIDIGENNRLRFELGPLPLVLAIGVCLWSLEPTLPERHRVSRWWRWFGLSAPPGELTHC